MISAEQSAEIRRLFYAEHWRVGTIAEALGLHRDTVKRAISAESFLSRFASRPRPTRLDPYLPFVRQTLEQYPKLRATRLHQMLVERGYPGSVVQLRRAIRPLRPRPAGEAYLELRTLPGEQAQADWGSFGTWEQRRLSCFVMVLSWSRAIHAMFTLDQSMESFLRGHVEAFDYFGGVPRAVLYEYVARHIFGVLFPFPLCGGDVWQQWRSRRCSVTRAHNSHRESSQLSRVSSSRHTGFRGNVSDAPPGGSHARSAAALVRIVISA